MKLKKACTCFEEENRPSIISFVHPERPQLILDHFKDKQLVSCLALLKLDRYGFGRTLVFVNNFIYTSLTVSLLLSGVDDTLKMDVFFSGSSVPS